MQSLGQSLDDPVDAVAIAKIALGYDRYRRGCRAHARAAGAVSAELAAWHLAPTGGPPDWQPKHDPGQPIVKDGPGEWSDWSASAVRIVDEHDRRELLAHLARDV